MSKLTIILGAIAIAAFTAITPVLAQEEAPATAPAPAFKESKAVVPALCGPFSAVQRMVDEDPNAQILYKGDMNGQHILVILNTKKNSLTTIVLMPDSSSACMLGITTDLKFNMEMLLHLMHDHA